MITNNDKGASMRQRKKPQWLRWARMLQEIAQTGLAYVKDPYDAERYVQIREIAAEMLMHGTEEEIVVIRGLLEGSVGYATPKVDVRGVVFEGETVLLVRERSEGLWSLPGGWANPDESPSESVTREIQEESGYLTRPTRLLALLDRDRHGHPPHLFSIYKLFFACERIGGAMKESNETDGVAFFPLDTLPPLSLGRVTEAEIADLFALHCNPSSLTAFD